jgi:uncharacterized protein YuzE
MATPDITKYLELVPTVLDSPNRFLWSFYDDEADVLYINFKKPARATDSELTDDDIIVRYEGDEMIGLTILHARLRGRRAA